MTFDDWYQAGLDNGWCTPVVCATHDGIPSTLYEDEEWSEGHDPCQWIVRLYDDPAHREAIEMNSPFLAWRRDESTPKE